MHLELGPTFGAVLIGTLASTALYGFVSSQALTYFATFAREDRWQIILMVVVIWMLETAHVVLIGHYIYWNLISNYCNPAAMTMATDAENYTIGLIAAVTFIVHCFYSQRLWILSGKMRWLAFIILSLALIHLGLELSVMSLTFKYLAFADFSIFRPFFASSLAVGASLDILIAGCVTYFLKTKGSGFQRTEDLINHVVAYAIGSGALTSITDVLILICFVVMPGNLISISIYTIIPDLYSISLLSTLNQRASLRKMNMEEVSSWSRFTQSGTVPPPARLPHFTSGGPVFRNREGGNVGESS